MPDRPNILFILADDLGWADLSMHGSRIRTPHIDRLAAEGVELEQHYVCPMCTPTRVSLLTGRHPGRFGAHATVPSNAPVLPDGYPTLATVLRDAGYDTGLFGKWHLGSEPRVGPNAFGFNTAYGSLAGGVDPYNHRYKQGPFSVTWHRNGELVQEHGHVTDLIAGEAARWIETRDEPWFCYVPFTAVHVPIKPTHASVAAYHDETFDDDPDRDASYRKYAAYTSHMDAAVGMLLEAVEATCRRENTLVVFASDNGAINDSPLHATDTYPGWQQAYPRLGSNAPWRGVKAQLYEGGIRTPTIVNWRSVLPHGRRSAPAQVVDWMPTICGLARTAPACDPQYDGTDIWPLVDGSDTDPGPRDLYWNFRGGRSLGFRRGDWKLISTRTENEERRELFDLAQDPCETTDLSGEREDVLQDLCEGMNAARLPDGSSARSDVDSPMVS